jgi:hypothetical protein
VLVAPLCSWLIGLPLLSAFAALWCITESLGLRTQVPCHTPDSSAVRDRFFAPPLFSRAGAASIGPAKLVLDYSLLFLAFSFKGEGWSAQGLHWIIFLGRGGEGSHAWCVMLTCIFCSFMQAALELAAGEK